MRRLQYVILCLENGTDASDIVSATLCDGSTSGSSQYGSWSVGANGCLTFAATNNAGTNLAPICVVVCDGSGRCDTTIYIPSVIPTTDTIPDTVCQGCVVEICFDGVIPDNFVNNVTTTLCDGSTSTTTTYANYSINSAGCLVIEGGTIPGRDTICVIVCDPVVGLCDTTIVIIEVPGVKDTIPFNVPVNETVTVCDPVLENGTDAIDIVSATLCDGSTSGSSQYGSWSVGANGCLTFAATNNAGTNLAPICVVVCDGSGRCDTTIYIPSVIPTTDTIPDTVCQGCVVEICFDGVIPDNFVNNVTTTLCDGSTSTTTTYANYSINSAGCLVIEGGTIPGRDTICVIVCDPVVGLCDTTIVIIEVPGVKDTIPFDVPVNETITVCDPVLENGTDASDIVSATLCDGSTSGSSQYGSWSVGANGCLTFAATNNAGTNLAPICVVVCDGSGRCDTTIYIPSVIPTTDTIPDTVCQGCVVEICFDGVIPDNFVNNVTTTLCDGSTSTTTTYANYSINSAGCLVIEGGTIPGRDTICVIVCDPVVGLCDTTIVIIEVPGVKDTIPFDVPVNETITVCDPVLENGTDASDIVSATLCGGGTQGFSQYGQWSVGADGCLTFAATNNAGANLAPICVVVCDGSGRCDTTIYIPSVIPTTDTIPDTVCQGCVVEICFDGVIPDNFVNNVTTTLCDGSTSTSTEYANYSINEKGCLIIDAGTIPGRDTICVTVCDPVVGLCDTTIIIIDVPGIKDTLPFDVFTDSTVIVCDPVFENGTNAGNIVSASLCDGSQGGSSIFGTWSVDPVSGCLTYTANAITGVDVDTICVVVCDGDGHCDTTIYLATINLSPPVEPCFIDVFGEEDSITIGCDGTGKGDFCMPLTQVDILTNYDLYVDGQLYVEVPGACDPGIVGSYDMGEGIRSGRLVFDSGVTTVVTGWTVNGGSVMSNSPIANLNDLVDSMNTVDPAGSWTLVAGDRIAGGNAGSTYGLLNIDSKVGDITFATFNAEFSSGVVFRGSEITLAEGCHLVKVIGKEDGCIDSIYVCVVCLPIPSMIGFLLLIP